MKSLGKGEDKAYKSLGRPEDRDKREGISRRASLRGSKAAWRQGKGQSQESWEMSPHRC